MSMDKNHKNNSGIAKKEVIAHYHKYTLRQSKREELLNMLQQNPVHTENKRTQNWLSKHRIALISSLLSAAAAASATLWFTGLRTDLPADPIAELALLPAGHKLYPPDFDLDGDSTNLTEIIQDIFADKNFFVSDLPPQIVAEYAPATGRFFSWDGEPAVSIEMNKNNVTLSGGQAATLFIVKLSEKSKRKFPQEKQTRKVAGRAGKVRKVKIWREGDFGYAMLQDTPINTP